MGIVGAQSTIPTGRAREDPPFPPLGFGLVVWSYSGLKSSWVPSGVAGGNPAEGATLPSHGIVQEHRRKDLIARPKIGKAPGHGVVGKLVLSKHLLGG